MALRTISSRALAPLLLAAVAPVAQGIGTGSISIGLESITSVAGPPVDLIHAGDGTDRIFIAGQNTGDIRLFKNNALVTAPFLDIDGATTSGGAGIATVTGGEAGLLGMAFHPNFAAPAGTPGSGKFYTFTSEPKGPAVDFSHPELGTSGGDHDSVIREWNISATDPDKIDPASSRVLMRIRKPQANHNGGALRFGPDGYLYIALGDGGGGDDQVFTNSSTDGHTNTIGNAQDLTNVFGKILRIDPLRPSDKPTSPNPVSTNGFYRIPADNPFIGPTTGVDEIFAYGLRNPFRFTFDRASGALFTGDVGQGQREEVDIITKGKNYGWTYMEGTLPHQTFSGSPTLTPPLVEYSHSDGTAIIGGYVYNGQNIPELSGKYVFGDLALGSNGRLFYVDTTGGTISEFGYLNGNPSGQLYSIGEDRDGELYALFASGQVMRILGRQWYFDGSGSWNTSTNWLGAVPNGTGTAANFLGRLHTAGNAPATITLDGNKTVGVLRFNNVITNGANPNSFTLAPGTGGTLTLDNGAANALISVIHGNHSISAPITIAGNTDADIAPGSTLSIAAQVLVNAGKTLTKKNTGALVATTPISLASGATLTASAGSITASAVVGSGSLIVQAPGTVRIPASGTPASTSRLALLSLAAGAKLDLNDNDLLVAYGTSPNPFTQIRQWVSTGYSATPNPAKAGIISTTGQSAGNTILALVDNRFPAATTWDGMAIIPNTIIGKYTYFGDVNLDGQVTGDDYAILDANYLTTPQPGIAWVSGDMNFDGIVTADDYGILDANIGAGVGHPLAPAAAVPEPAASLALCAAFSLLSRRRRR